MNNFLITVAALLAGLVLGLGFFGGLWWTVRGSIVSRHPALWFLVSLLVRTALAVGGFYGIGRAFGWRLLLVALVGFIGARFGVEWATRRPAEVVDEIADGGER